MKKVFFLIVTILFYAFSFAQKEKEVKPNQELSLDQTTPEMFRYYKMPYFKGPLSNNPLDSSSQYNDATAFQPNAKFLYKTDKGSVYALPLDNMPCLRPDFKSNMPIFMDKPNGYIPNPLWQSKLNGKMNNVKVIPLVK
ncbi:MAG: hypothetical protein ABI204_01445 [Ginsengibacter sp.]